MSGTEVDAVLSRLGGGGYGRYQWLLFFAMGLFNLSAAWGTFILMFAGWPPEHHCTPWANHTLNESLPREENDYGEMAWSQCSMYEDPGSEGEPYRNSTVSCQHGWTYVWDREGETSVVSEWDLVCEQSYMSELPMTVFMVGSSVGMLVLSPLPDMWGRKVVLLTCFLLQAATSVVTAFLQGPVAFVIMQLFRGTFFATAHVCGYLLVAETFDKDHREVPFFCLGIFWSAGLMLLSLVAYLLPQWRHLTLAVSLPQVPLLVFGWLLSESVPWLLNKGNVERARVITLYILRFNKLSPSDDLDATLNAFQKGLPKLQGKLSTPEAGKSEALGRDSEVVVAPASHSTLDLFRTPRLRRYSLIVPYLFLVNSLAYFGISFSMPSLSGDKYINSLISGAVEIPAYSVVALLHRRVGRRISLIVFMLICTGANVIAIFIPSTPASGPNLSDLRTAVVMVGKFGITASYSVLYLYGAEIFPTSLRSHAVGLCTCFESLGSIAAPPIVYVAKTMTQLPMTLFSVLTIVGAALVLLLPETHNAPLPQTIADVENSKENLPRQTETDHSS